MPRWNIPTAGSRGMSGSIDGINPYNFILLIELHFVSLLLPINSGNLRLKNSLLIMFAWSYYF